MIKVASDPIMCRIEGANGSCFVQFEGGHAYLWRGSDCTPLGPIVSTKSLSNLLNEILTYVGANE